MVCVLMVAPTDGLSLLFFVRKKKKHSIHWLIIIVPYFLREYGGHKSGVLQRSYIVSKCLLYCPNISYIPDPYGYIMVNSILDMGQNWLPLTNFMVNTKHISKDVYEQKGDLFATSSSGNHLRDLDGFVEAFL